ncbi:uncharacterized protein LOC114851881 [Betta splendens]|uniref:Interleukin-1 n=1 Tax=Betta splendens TaxID=158456 RepID=A0A6P7LXN4_BETSP|nr:uncharacterized protein LOC114851881 [Betta splendens]
MAGADTSSTMDLKDSPVKGGVFIVHQVHEGKHQYVVDNVVNYKTRRAEKMFVRGDRLIKVNDMDLRELQPEALAKMLAEGNPTLEVHKASEVEEHQEQPSQTVETFYPISKEFTMLRFSVEMKKEEDEVEPEDGGWQEEGSGGQVCQGGNEESDLVVVTMEKTSISVLKGRGCEKEDACPGCHGTGCAINDVVMVSKSSTVTLVPRGSYKQETHTTASIENTASHQYLRALCCGSVLYASPNPEKITIYHYKSSFVDSTFRGMPVVLNFTDTNLFLRCCKDGERASLQLETYEKQKLRQIAKSDERALSFVFYMKSDNLKLTKFESALHSGWFIQIVSINTDFQVTIDTCWKDDPSFLFVIRK